VNLVVRRTIHATAERLFEAWTEPARLKEWWGPASVSCTDAEIDLRVGGRYRIANQFPDGKVVWIAGEFEIIEPPHRLVYSWGIESSAQPSERVTVRFEPVAGATEVIVVHERIPDSAARDQHERGWQGCLDGLTELLADAERLPP
jgi:uncharacterized protein YndB with AHSA1/START domain